MKSIFSDSSTMVFTRSVVGNGITAVISGDSLRITKNRFIWPLFSDSHRYGAKVTVIHRGEEIKKSVKYWILPDFMNRVQEGALTLHLQSVVTHIADNEVTIQNVITRQETIIANDSVFALTGYRPDEHLLRMCGIQLDERLVPLHNPETLETNVRGIYVAGSVSAGLDTNKLFIENGRFHGKTIVEHIRSKE